MEPSSNVILSIENGNIKLQTINSSLDEDKFTSYSNNEDALSSFYENENLNNNSKIKN